MAKNKTDTTQCFPETIMKPIWGEENAFDFSLPILILQLALITAITRVLTFVLKPTKQPRFVSEVIGVIIPALLHRIPSELRSYASLGESSTMAGLIIGPSVLGKHQKFVAAIFPVRSLMMLETMSNVGILYSLFLIGVEMDLTLVLRTGKKAWAIAIAGIIMPFCLGWLFFLILGTNHRKIDRLSYSIFISIALSATAFPMVARILTELKLLNTELGKMAMSSALVNDLATWILLFVAVVFFMKRSIAYSLWSVFLFLLYVIICIYVVRPAISRIIGRTPDGEAFSELHICIVLSGVLLSAFITDAIGTHPVFGAFVFGLVIPNGALGVSLIEKLENFVTGLLMPLFFTLIGMKIKIDADNIRYRATITAIPLACATKIVGTLLASFFSKMSRRECVTLGFLLNAKGLVELIVLNIGLDMMVLDRGAYAFMVCASLIMTGIITPILKNYRPEGRLIPYMCRTILSENSDRELRVLMCIHGPRNVPTIINLLEASHPTKKSPICVYALHLVELTGHASAMLIVHNNQQNGQTAVNRTQAQTDQIIDAFENYEQHAECVSVQPLTAISSYSTIHEDICNLAVDKCVAFIVVPFHKQQAIDGGMEDTNPAFRIMNQNVLANAPCSVGILIDRGLTGPTRLAANQVSHHIAVLYFGGPDDREALAYGWRMSEHPETKLTVMRFLQGENPAQLEVKHSDEPNKPILTEEINLDVEMQVDEDYINYFRMKTAHDDSIIYTEKVVNNGSESVHEIISMENIYDLFIVGRGEQRRSPLTEGLNDWSECPELGPIGDLLASSDFAGSVSVLVVQQYVGVGTRPDVSRQPPPVRNDQFNVNQII